MRKRRKCGGGGWPGSGGRDRGSMSRLRGASTEETFHRWRGQAGLREAISPSEALATLDPVKGR